MGKIPNLANGILQQMYASMRLCMIKSFGYRLDTAEYDDSEHASFYGILFFKKEIILNYQSNTHLF